MPQATSLSAFLGEIPVRMLPARAESLSRFTGEIIRLRLKLPRAARLQFLAGQYIDILLPEGKRRAFSIAPAPSETEFLELHIKHVDGGGFAGPPAMVHSARTAFLGAGVPEDRLFFDSFDFAPDVPPATNG